MSIMGRVRSSTAVRVQGHLETNSSEVIRAGVLSGMGICYSPTWLFEHVARNMGADPR
jgi:DNA-binding transcriptional LysR family regulator